MSSIIDILPNLFRGLEYTLIVFSLTLLLSFPLSIFVAWGRVSKNKLIQKPLATYITIMRGTPLLLQVIFIYYGLPLIGIVFDRLTAVIIAFTLNYAAYLAEILRGGIQSIDPGQYEASQVTGISTFQTYRYIIIPQVLARTLTAISNEVITLVKDTSLIYVVGIGELLHAAKIQANLHVTLIPYILAGVIYLIIILILTRILTHIERRFVLYER
ncbi:MAG: amino acid ABC transporter permease [Bacilli bacterium]|nr:amino acid ABC transporter permease [Bacilli bacterium]